VELQGGGILDTLTRPSGSGDLLAGSMGSGVASGGQTGQLPPLETMTM